jgi:N4-gp56 family major capsid protein
MAKFLTSETNFSSAVVVDVKKSLVSSLRSGTPWSPAGSIIPATLVPGTNGTVRWFSVKDLPSGYNLTLAEGVPPATPQSMELDYTDLATVQLGHFVQSSDLSAEELGFGLHAAMAEKVSRQVTKAVDDLLRAAYVAQAAEITSTTIIDEPDIYKAVAYMRRRNVKPLKDGFYAAIAGPEVLADLQQLEGWIGASKYAQPDTLLTGEVGQFAGCKWISTSNDAEEWSATSGDVVRIEADDELMTLASHGLIPNQRINFVTLTGGTGLTAGVDYFVHSVPDANTLKISATKGGAAIDVTADATAGTFKYAYKRIQIVGAESAVFGDAGSIQILVAAGPSYSDPLAQNYSVGWKMRGAAALAKFNEADNPGTDVPRTIGIKCDTSFCA